jgi:hypothetical protein
MFYVLFDLIKRTPCLEPYLPWAENCDLYFCSEPPRQFLPAAYPTSWLDDFMRQFALPVPSLGVDSPSVCVLLRDCTVGRRGADAAREFMSISIQKTEFHPEPVFILVTGMALGVVSQVGHRGLETVQADLSGVYASGVYAPHYGEVEVLWRYGQGDDPLMEREGGVKAVTLKELKHVATAFEVLHYVNFAEDVTGRVGRWDYVTRVSKEFRGLCYDGC